ncbi:hypothetical protein EMIHUDRAFT_451029, partial [Emiliania huxleyi CCMP1516]|uniref:Uncharacterized protein n=2 Tax=Emiliania huxleyi TaxID=2903 RepID=A0A0D3J8Y3_EMIH1
APPAARRRQAARARPHRAALRPRRPLCRPRHKLPELALFSAILLGRPLAASVVLVDRSPTVAAARLRLLPRRRLRRHGRPRPPRRARLRRSHLCRRLRRRERDVRLLQRLRARRGEAARRLRHAARRRTARSLLRRLRPADGGILLRAAPRRRVVVAPGPHVNVHLPAPPAAHHQPVRHARRLRAALRPQRARGQRLVPCRRRRGGERRPPRVARRLRAAVDAASAPAVVAAHTAPFEVDAAEGGRARVSPGPRREGGGRLELARAGSCAGHVPYEVHSQRERERGKRAPAR